MWVWIKSQQYVAVQSRSQQGLKKSSETTAADVPCNIEHIAGSKKLEAKSINDSDNVTMDYKSDK